MTILRCTHCSRYGLGSRCQFCGRSLALREPADTRPVVSEGAGAAWVAFVGALYTVPTYLLDGPLVLGLVGVACVLVTWWLLVRKCRVED